MASFAPIKTASIINERVITKSSEILNRLFGLTPADFGKLARDITELETPGTQGNNAKALAEHIISNDKSNKYYNRAEFFIQQWNSNTCYICGGPIDDGPHMEELEHVLPIAEALGLTAIIQQKTKPFKKEIPELSKTQTAELYLLEYARAHTCCNQIKGVTSFLSFNPTRSGKHYDIDNNSLTQVLKGIWKNAGNGGIIQQGDNSCGNVNLKRYISSFSLESFIQSRKEFIIPNYLEPILSIINGFINSPDHTLGFALLCYLSNQALSIDQTVWSKMGITLPTWRGREISDKKVFIDQIIDTIKRNSSYTTQKKAYEEVRKQVVDLIFRNFQSSRFLNTYYDNKKSSVRSSRGIDPSNFASIINSDFLIFKKMHTEYLINVHFGVKYVSASASSSTSTSFLTQIQDVCFGESFFGLEYLYYLIYSQEDEFKFNTGMIDDLITMTININKFTTMYVMLFIIMNIPYKKEYDSRYDIANYPTTALPIDELINNNPSIDYNEKQLQIIRNKFVNFNFFDELYRGYFLNLEPLNNYGSYIALSIPNGISAGELLHFNKEATKEIGIAFSLLDLKDSTSSSKGGINDIIQAFESRLPSEIIENLPSEIIEQFQEHTALKNPKPLNLHARKEQFKHRSTPGSSSGGKKHKKNKTKKHKKSKRKSTGRTIKRRKTTK